MHEEREWFEIVDDVPLTVLSLGIPAVVCIFHSLDHFPKDQNLPVDGREKINDEAEGSYQQPVASELICLLIRVSWRKTHSLAAVNLSFSFRTPSITRRNPLSKRKVPIER